jgi:CHAT domain/RIP homotypic interaction motif
MADLREQPGSAALAPAVRAQLYAAREPDPQLASDLAGVVDAPRPARYDVNISHAQNVQIGDRNVQHNVSDGGSAGSRLRNVILTVFSNPFGTDGLRLDEEYRAIAQAIQAGRYRERLDIVSAPAARYDELGPHIQHHRPVVVHVGGHGSQTGELVFADEGGRPFDVSTSALADLFASHAATIRCVVLNGCFTKRLADAIAVYGPCVVGTSRAIPDVLAIEFAGAFYAAVANGRRFDEAFADGRNRLDLGDRSGGDAIVFAEGRGARCGTAVD